VQKVDSLVKHAVMHSGAQILDVLIRFRLMDVVDIVYIPIVLVHMVETLWQVENLLGSE